MESRKLVMLAAEEERRQRILNERKKFHREATERFRQATERCKTGPPIADGLLPNFPPAVAAGVTCKRYQLLFVLPYLSLNVLTIMSNVTAKPGSAKSTASTSDDWESSLIAARCNSARRILSKKDSELFKSASRLEFPPLNPRQSFTSNDGAVPIGKLVSVFNDNLYSVQVGLVQ